ncbi:DUF6503 family protein [Fulvivirga sedimenti]|uniref:DUF6503 family protein n=1 Tax=Fulvivirga sedimenti TaxID=2879465 RepID=A0A9X1KZV7_9BACT|nr:DUF6503 family protein [Fulvivirga sedimenti]MCA6078725.1 DUF6503 family protein [Fulvivirga sedimenti]
MRFISSIFLLASLGWLVPEAELSERTRHTINQSRSFHDPTGKWDNALLNFHIEEPRVANPTRFSEIFLNVADGTFSLVRNREDHLTTYSMDANGKPMVLLDGSEQFDEELRARYRLYPDRVAGYRDFYRVMYGLPMSLDLSRIRNLGDVAAGTFQGNRALVFTIEWKKPLIKPVWKVFLDPDTHSVMGVELIEPDNADAGERIVFQGLVEYQGIRIPHMRHWYSLKNNSYLGSDIIITNEEF